MRSLIVKPASSLKGEITLLGDKSIAHRSIIISAISKGKTIIKNFPNNQDCLYTLKALRKLSIRITPQITPLGCKRGHSEINVFGKGLYGLKKPKTSIFVGDSGTTLRLLLGILAGQGFKVRLTTGKSLAQRPMRRVTEPLRMMGAEIKSRIQDLGSRILEEYPPITIKGGNLKPITYKMPVASAQVKSAILFSGLYAFDVTRVIELIKTRDHTERMLKLFKADIKFRENTVAIKGKKELVSPHKIYIPGDISSASFFIVLATLLPKSRILIKNVNLNPSRMGVIRVLKRMGANIRLSVIGSRLSALEPMGNIFVKSSKLKGTTVKKGEIPSLIDELPILMVTASLASGRTVFEGVGELRVKETDRIRSMSENLIKMGALIRVFKDAGSEKIVIQGVKELRGSRVRSFGDHRTAMSMVIAGLVAKGKAQIDDVSCIDKSFPDFLKILKTLIP